MRKNVIPYSYGMLLGTTVTAEATVRLVNPDSENTSPSIFFTKSNEEKESNKYVPMVFKSKPNNN